MLLSAGNFVVYRAESQVFNLLEPRFGDLRVRHHRRKLLAAWKNTSLFMKTGLEASQIEQEVMANCENAGDFLRIVMEAMARKQGVERWAETTPDHLLSLPRIKETIPNALVIHLIRDGRDVALSLEKQHWIRPFAWDHGKELLTAAAYWDWIVNQGRTKGRALGDDYQEVRYEDLVADPRSTLAKVGRFIGQDLDYDQILHVGIGSVSRPNSSFDADKKPGGFHPVARWKKSLSEQQLGEVEGLIGQTLDELGYAREVTQPSEEPPAALKRMRNLYNTYYSAKLVLKTKTPVGRFVGGDLRFLGGQAEVPAQSSETFERAVRVLQIGNYPPPMCGWAIQLKLVTEELRRRGHVCEVLKINEGRQIKSSEYVDVQSGPDYLKKIFTYSLRGYRLNVHLNGMSKKGYWLAMAAALTGRLLNRPALVTFHGGLSQDYFPRHEQSLVHHAFYALFRIAGEVACDSDPIREAIIKYGVRPDKVASIATFSPQYLKFAPVEMPKRVEDFLQRHVRIILSYVSFRPEYRLDVLRDAMRRYRAIDPEAGFIWLGFPGREMQAAEEFVRSWPAEEQATLLLLGNLTHDEFLSLLRRCYVYLRTPACDGVAASVLESLALKVPVVASANGRRPSGIIPYNETDAADMVEKLRFVREHYDKVKESLQTDAGDDNVGRMADWLVGDLIPVPQPVTTRKS
jgi:glycosyltransferase involved in cell wall biosynthesis